MAHNCLPQDENAEEGTTWRCGCPDAFVGPSGGMPAWTDRRYSHRVGNAKYTPALTQRRWVSAGV